VAQKRVFWVTESRFEGNINKLLNSSFLRYVTSYSLPNCGVTSNQSGMQFDSGFHLWAIVPNGTYG